MSERLVAFYRRHYGLWVLLLLFVSFRGLAILLFRPGGFITDFSDYDFYYTWGTLTPMGYRAYDNLWTAYPPLFPALMLPIFEWAARIPAWVEPQLWFHVLFGGALLIFETANLLLIYRLGNRLGDESSSSILHPLSLPQPGLLPATLYALLFVPVYTLVGWFEPMPLFFLLLGLELLLARAAWGWVASAVVVGLGFLTKLTPAVLIPVAVWWLAAQNNSVAARGAESAAGTEKNGGMSRVLRWLPVAGLRWGSLWKPVVYGLIFGVVVVGVGYPLVAANPSLALSSFRVQSIRPPWQSVWALLDGFYGYGLVPLDMRNLTGLAGPLWETRLPWGWITLGFALVYLWLYWRPYDWPAARTPVAFTAASVILLFLYSKGWSPQFLVWVLVFIVLLLPTLTGIAIAVLLSLVNFVEADLYLILLPEEHWLLAGTVLVRTALLILLMVEFLGQIWPRGQTGQAMRRVGRGLAWAVVAAALVGAVVSAPAAAEAYNGRRLAEHPCAGVLAQLREQAGGPTQTILTQQPEVWRDFYPWLRGDYAIKVLDGYGPDQNPAEVALARLSTAAPQGEFWWIERSDTPFSGTSPAEVRTRFFEQPGVQATQVMADGVCTLYRVAKTG